MSQEIKLALIILLGIVLTFTVMIIGSIYNNNHNISRDEFYASHCQVVTKTVSTYTDPAQTKYSCGVTK